MIITNSTETPVAAIRELVRILLESLSLESNPAENKEQLRKLLAQLRQRHPGAFSEASSGVVSKRDEDGRTQIEQLILSLSVVGWVTAFVDRMLSHSLQANLDSVSSTSMKGKTADLIIASMDSDPSARAVAVRGLLGRDGGDKVPYRATACRRIAH